MNIRRYCLLVGAIITVNLVACGDSDPSDADDSASGGTSSSHTGKASGGTSSSQTGGNETAENGGNPSDGSAGSSGDSANGDAGETGGSETGGTGGAPAPSTFDCADQGPLASDSADRKCFDFSKDEDMAAFSPDGGDWTAENGGYVGHGPSEAVTCTDAGSMFTASTLSDFSAADVRLHASLTSITRVDKALVLRARDSGNRIELNFRAGFVIDDENHGNDLVIQELVDCEYIEHVAPGTVAVPHTELQTIAVDVQLRGQLIKITVDGKDVYDDTLPFTTTEGSVGFAVITDSVEMFDDFVVETLK